MKRLIPLLFLMLSILACAETKKMGGLKADGTPVVFEAGGKKPPTWTATVEAEVAYELIVRSTTETNSFIRIRVFDHQGQAFDEDSLLVEKTENYSSPEAKAVFVGPPSGKVDIYVLPGLGENGEETGQFSIRLQKLP